MARPGHLYVMDAGDGLVKVGFANDPQARAKVLKMAAVLHVSQWDGRAELIEKAAHRLLKLAGTHVENEIFSASVDEAINAIRSARASHPGHSEEV